MKFDKPEHKEIIKQLLAGATYPGDMVKLVADLMDAVERADIDTNDEHDLSRPNIR